MIFFKGIQAVKMAGGHPIMVRFDETLPVFAVKSNELDFHTVINLAGERVKEDFSAGGHSKEEVKTLWQGLKWRINVFKNEMESAGFKVSIKFSE